MNETVFRQVFTRGESVIGIDFFNNNNDYLSPFSEELEPPSDSRINRSFETLITERNTNDDTLFYSHVYKEIKNKM